MTAPTAAEHPAPGRRPGAGQPLALFCDVIDAVNLRVGLVVGASVVFVTFAVVYEVVGRTVFQRPTIWSNETSIYLSAVTYLIAGSYTLLYDRHVRIDVLYGALSERTQTRLDIVNFFFTLVYVGALIWLGGKDFWNAFALGETTGTPWNPPIWPVKLAIPVAGVLIALQAVANILRKVGLAPQMARP